MLPQKYTFKTAPLKNTFSKFYLNKYFFKIASSKIHFLKCFLKKIFFKKYFFKNYTLKKYIFIVILSKKTFSNLFSQKNPQKNKRKKNQNTFLKLLSQSCSLKNTFSKLLFQKNAFSKLLSQYEADSFNLIFFIRIIRRAFYVINNMSNYFFSISLHSF